MPNKPTAILLTRKNLDLISNTLHVDVKNLEEVIDYNFHYESSEPIFFVKEPIYFGAPMTYLIYKLSEFLNNFATLPCGVEDHFVPVTQVKDGP